MSWLIAQTSAGGLWMPQQSSTVAHTVDGLFDFIVWITGIFFLLVVALTVVFVVKYRHREGREKPEASAAHSTALELTWTVIPTVLVLMVFYFGFRGYLNMDVAPPNSYEIQVTATMWNWAFTYPNGYVSNELHVPVNVPVLLVMTSQDVIHSVYVPQFRVKRDVVPDRFNRFWFQAIQQGEFDIYCAEYCGNGHSTMLTKVVVQDIDAYRKWLEEAGNWETRMSPVQAGEMLVKANGCLQCHTTTGSASNGPTFLDLFGKQEPLADGSSVLVDENYIAESLYEPAAKVVRGFTVQMQSYRGRFKDKDVGAIIAYLKSISANYKSQLPATATTTQPK